MLIKKELICGILLTSAVMVAFAVIPVLGFLLGAVVPLAVFYYSRSSRIQGVLVFAISLVAAFAGLKLAGIPFSIPLMFSWGVVGIVLSECFRRKYPLDKAVFYSILAFAGVGLAFLLSYCLRIGEDPWTLIQAYIRMGVQEGIQTYELAGLAPDQINIVRDHETDIVNAVYHMFPALVVIGATFFIWVNIMGARLVYRLRGLAFPVEEDLGCWKIPEKMVWFVIASGALMLIPGESFTIAGANLLSIFLFMYFFQGLAIVHFFFQKRAISGFLRGFFYFLVFVQHFLMLAVIGLGFFDLWIDFRKLNREVNLSAQKGETR